MCAVLNLKIFTFIGGNIAKVARFRVMVAVSAIFTTQWCKNADICAFWLKLLGSCWASIPSSRGFSGLYMQIAGVLVNKADNG